MEVVKKEFWQFPSDLNVLDRVLSSFEGLNQPFIPQMAWLQCQLALAEAFTNAVRHAHHHLPSDTKIDIEITIYNEALEIRVWDCGEPFDLEARINNLVEDVNAELEGGRGLPILSQVADELTYRRTSDNRNCLLLVKHYQPEMKS